MLQYVNNCDTILIMKNFKKLIPAGSVTLGLTTLASYIVGLFRDRLFAQTFGASRALDAYNAAFLLPDLLFNILIASGIAAAFVPIFMELLHSDKHKADEYTNSATTGATSAMVVSAIVIALFAGSIGKLIAPGFNSTDLALVVKIL